MFSRARKALILLHLQHVLSFNCFSIFVVEHTCQIFYCRHHPNFLRMGVPVHGGLDVRVTHDSLQILYIRMNSSECGKGVTEDMGGAPCRSMVRLILSQVR